jgi:hypothetical protein
MAYIKLDGASFSEDYMKSISEGRFVREFSHIGWTEERLREAYRLVVPKKKTDYPNTPTPSEGDETREVAAP